MLIDTTHGVFTMATTRYDNNTVSTCDAERLATTTTAGPVTAEKDSMPSGPTDTAMSVVVAPEARVVV